MTHFEIQGRSAFSVLHEFFITSLFVYNNQSIKPNTFNFCDAYGIHSSKRTGGLAGKVEFA